MVSRDETAIWMWWPIMAIWSVFLGLIGRQPTKAIIITRNVWDLHSREWTCVTTVKLCPLTLIPDSSQFCDSEPLEWMRDWVSLRKEPVKLPHYIVWIFLQDFPEGPASILSEWQWTEEREITISWGTVDNQLELMLIPGDLKCIHSLPQCEFMDLGW